MGYIRKTVHTGNTVEVEEYFTNRIGIHDKRGKREKPTPEQTREAYIRRRKKHLRWLMNENFEDGKDALVTLSWGKSRDRPDTLKEVKEAARMFLRRLRREYEKLGRDLKYIYCVEIGPKGSRHIHAVLSGAGELPLMLIQRCWNGVVNIKPLNTQGQYEDLADYMVKSWAEKTEKTMGEELRRCYECSKNLKKPVIEIERIREKDLKKDIKEPPGACLDRSSVREGVNVITGRPYRFYRFRVLGEKGETCAGATEKTTAATAAGIIQKAKEKLSEKGTVKRRAKEVTAGLLIRAGNFFRGLGERWTNSK
jgi:hypothetical protein